jgi:hypothetical protein
MLTAITTTHAIPKKLPSAHITVRTTVIVCPYCLETLGSSLNMAERQSIEGSHKCREKLLARQPAISIPFS